MTNHYRHSQYIRPQSYLQVLSRSLRPPHRFLSAPPSRASTPPYYSGPPGSWPIWPNALRHGLEKFERNRAKSLGLFDLWRLSAGHLLTWRAASPTMPPEGWRWTPT